MSATTTTTEVDRYVAAVQEHLAGVPEAEREELLDDLRQHLLEVAAEEGGSLELRLGPARDYAEELRASAGLPPAGMPGGRLQQLASSARAHPAVTRATAAMAELTGDARIRQLGTFWRDVQPGWWVARAYLFLLGWSLSSEPWALMTFPLPRVLGRRGIGLVVLVLLVVLSLRAGRRAPDSRGYRLLTLAFTALGLVGILWIGVALNDVAQRPLYYESEPAWNDSTDGLFGANGNPITNIYPFDASGRPLDQVLLYDQDGNPIDIVVDYSPAGEPVVTSYPLTDGGAPVMNAFPQRQALRHGTGWDDHEDSFEFGTRPQPDPPVLVPPADEEE